MLMIDLDRLLKLRLIVGRHGEMDRARWWNTQGMLGRHGEMALSRGLPRTHYFAQARVVFAVAASRSNELFDSPGGITLWRLPAALEDQFDERWHDWLDAGDDWADLFESLASSEDDLRAQLQSEELLSDLEAAEVEALEPFADGRALEVPAGPELTNELLTLLAAGFTRGAQGSPVVPYGRLAE